MTGKGGAVTAYDHQKAAAKGKSKVGNRNKPLRKSNDLRFARAIGEYFPKGGDGDVSHHQYHSQNMQGLEELIHVLDPLGLEEKWHCAKGPHGANVCHIS